MLDIEVPLRNVVDELLNDVEALIHLFNVAIVAIHRVAARHNHLFEVHFVVNGVWVMLANVVAPATCTTGRTCYAIADTLFFVHRTYAYETLVCDDVVAEDVEIFLNHRSQILAELLCVLHEVRVDVVLQSTYSIIVLNQSSTRSFFHHVQHVFAVAHTVEHGCKST